MKISEDKVFTLFLASGPCVDFNDFTPVNYDVKVMWSSLTG